MKLIDFGFLLDLSRLDPAAPVARGDIPGASYISPEHRQIKEGHASFADLALAAGADPGVSGGEALMANDVWMLGQLLYKLLVRPNDGQAFGAKFDSLGPDGWRTPSGVMGDQAALRLAALGLPEGVAERLHALLYERVLVPVRRRVRDARDLARELAGAVGQGVLDEGRAGLLSLAWPLLAPCPTPARPLHDAGAPGDGNAPHALFEADLDWVQVRIQGGGGGQ